MKDKKKTSAVVVPEFIQIVRSENQIEEPREAVGRCHTERLYGAGSGRIAWSPVTKDTIENSGWLPRGKTELPTLYTVCFVGKCPECLPRVTYLKCRHPIKTRRISGEIIVDSSGVLGERHLSGRVVPVSVEEFVRLEWQARRPAYDHRQGWTKDGKGPVTLAGTIGDCLGRAVAEIAKVSTANRSTVTLVELKPLYSAVLEANEAATSLREKLSFRKPPEG